ncbi:MAG: MarR family transcriptional regulator [Candidatus Thermoplasmatota archaeon]|nr:MarR family transcriptional regulator [Candidatus Thermoplasmatota archaeon]
MELTKIYKRIFLCNLLILIIFLPTTSAQDYYADVTIDVDSYGFVTIDGTTNYPDLLIKNTEIYTSKKQSYWLFNITKDENFTDFVYVLTLPEGSSINYIKTTGSIRIEEDQGKLIVNGFGENVPFAIQVQYQIGISTEEEFIKFDPVFIFLIAVIIILIAILAGIFVKEIVKTYDLKEDGYDFKGLNQRQKQIMKLLIDKKTPLTQTDIQRELNIPKAAVSRNIRGLELKGLIEKEQIGMSNLIRLKKI